MKKLLVMSVICGLVLSFPVRAVFAHGGEDHDAESDERIERMEALVAVLSQLIVVLTEYKTLYPHMPLQAAVAPVTTPAPVSEPIHDGEEMHEHESSEEHEPGLVIEVEEHFGNTHVHVRYTDKPEEMFFVAADMSDEAVLVAAIVAKTGLGTEEVKEALEYH